MSRGDAGGTYYQPLTVARVVINTAITAMNRQEPALYARAVDSADKLVEIMGPDGAFRYDEPHSIHYWGVLKPGWTSSMTQGTALSALARAYHLTCDKKYLEAGERALSFLLTPIEQGGTATTLCHLHPSLSDYHWYEEYPNPNKPGYTLNGYMYTLLGLYDWAEVADSARARTAFNEGIRTLIRVLPLYNRGGMSSYDLAPLVYGTPAVFIPRYHKVHLAQLALLHAITGEQMLEDYRALWYDTVGGPVEICRGGA